jgi:hypothetical protein
LLLLDAKIDPIQRVGCNDLFGVPAIEFSFAVSESGKPPIGNYAIKPSRLFLHIC